MRRFRFEYGAGSLHLLAVLAAFGIAGYAVLQVIGGAVGAPLSFLLWFAGAIVFHDLVLFPLYSLADRLCSRAARVRSGAGDARPSPVRAMALNHVRVPAALSGLLLLLWFPLILGLAEETYAQAAGMSTEGYLARWIGLSGALFAGSGLILAARLGRRSTAGSARGRR